MTTTRTPIPPRQRDAVLLDIPVVMQSSVTSCALATVSGIIWYLTGRHVPQRELSALLGQRWTVDGTRMTDAVSLVERLGKTRIEVLSATTFATITAALRRGHPMLASVHIDAQRGHMISVVGAVTGEHPHVVVNDPNFRWPLVIPWKEFAGSLQRIGFVGGMPVSATPKKDQSHPGSQQGGVVHEQ